VDVWRPFKDGLTNVAAKPPATSASSRMTTPATSTATPAPRARPKTSARGATTPGEQTCAPQARGSAGGQRLVSGKGRSARWLFHRRDQEKLLCRALFAGGQTTGNGRTGSAAAIVQGARRQTRRQQVGAARLPGQVLQQAVLQLQHQTATGQRTKLCKVTPFNSSSTSTRRLTRSR